LCVNAMKLPAVPPAWTGYLERNCAEALAAFLKTTLGSGILFLLKDCAES